MTCDREKCWCPCREDMEKEIERLKRELEQARAASSALVSKESGTA